MSPLPDLVTYQDCEALTPPEPRPCACGRLTCDWCGDDAYHAPYETGVDE